jgi:hypothetical protein
MCPTSRVLTVDEIGGGAMQQKRLRYHLFSPYPGNIRRIDEGPNILYTAASLHSNFQNGSTVNIGDNELAILAVDVLQY